MNVKSRKGEPVLLFNRDHDDEPGGLGPKSSNKNHRKIEANPFKMDRESKEHTVHAKRHQGEAESQEAERRSRSIKRRMGRTEQHTYMTPNVTCFQSKSCRLALEIDAKHAKREAHEASLY